MNRRVVIFGLTVLIAGLVVCTASAVQRIEVPYEEKVPYSDLEDKEQFLDRIEDFEIRKGEYASGSYNLVQGRNLNITWQAENNTVDLYVMDGSQYNGFTQTNVTQCVTKASAQSGFLWCPIPFNGTFHIVIYNDPERDINSVKMIYYESRLMWKENVTKYRFETRYREEPNYAGLNVGSAIFVIGCVIAVLGWRSSPRTPNSSKVP
jgi:hypothetical protein